MRYTKIALLTFGAGLMLGLVIVVAELDPLDRLASGLMAAGLAGIPVGMAVDWRLAVRTPRRPARRRAKPSRRGPAGAARRTKRARKPASPKR